jgi:hypothetical protein
VQWHDTVPRMLDREHEIRETLHPRYPPMLVRSSCSSLLRRASDSPDPAGPAAPLDEGGFAAPYGAPCKHALTRLSVFARAVQQRRLPAARLAHHARGLRTLRAGKKSGADGSARNTQNQAFFSDSRSPSRFARQVDALRLEEQRTQEARSSRVVRSAASCKLTLCACRLASRAGFSASLMR